MVMVAPVIAKTVNTFPTDDGGKRVETVFDKADNEYRYEKKLSFYDKDGRNFRDEDFILDNRYNNLGIQTIIKEYGQNGQLILVEIIFRQDIAVLAGYEKIILLLTPEEIKKRLDIVYTDANPDEQVYTKSVTYYDRVGVMAFTRFYFTPAVSKNTGLVRFEEEYDSRGNPVNQRFLTEDGRYR